MESSDSNRIANSHSTPQQTNDGQAIASYLELNSMSPRKTIGHAPPCAPRALNLVTNAVVVYTHPPPCRMITSERYGIYNYILLDCRTVHAHLNTA